MNILKVSLYELHNDPRDVILYKVIGIDVNYQDIYWHFVPPIWRSNVRFQK